MRNSRKKNINSVSILWITDIRNSHFFESSPEDFGKENKAGSS